MGGHSCHPGSLVALKMGWADIRPNFWAFTTNLNFKTTQFKIQLGRFISYSKVLFYIMAYEDIKLYLNLK